MPLPLPATIPLEVPI